MSDQKRPTWDLSGETHPATLPTDQLDADTSLQEAIAAKVGYDRYNDVTTVLGAALDYAAECMSDALAELAFRARDLRPVTAQRSDSGWHAFWEPGPSKATIDLVLAHETAPGGWHVSLRFRPVMTEAANRREAEIEARIEAANPNWTAIDRVLASISPRGGDPNTADLKKLRENPESYRPATPGDKLDRVYGTALDLGASGWRGVGPGGKPRDVEEFAHARQFLPVKAYGESWWNGIQLEMRPVSSYRRHEGMLVPGISRSGACPQIPARILSDLIRSTGLAPLVARQREVTGALPWISHGSDRGVALEEAGHAMVHAAGGFFDPSVDRRLTEFWAGIAAQDVERHLKDWFNLAPELAAAGYGFADREFSCNDGRDLAQAVLTSSTP